MAECFIMRRGLGNDSENPGSASEDSYVNDGLITREIHQGSYNSGKICSYKDNVSSIISGTQKTIEICCKVTEIPGLYGYIWASGGSTSHKITISKSDNIPSGEEFGLMFSDYDVDRYSNALLKYNTFYTITLTINDSAAYFYINGEKIDQSLNRRNNITSNTIAVFTGAGDKSSGRDVTGTWYTMRIYDRVLTDAEILQNHNADVVNYSN